MSTRKVLVVCGTNKWRVEVDFKNLKKTKEAIRKKLKLTGDFDIETAFGEKGDHVSIVDDGDLDEFKETDTLIVRLPTEAPPAYEASLGVAQPLATAMTVEQERITVDFRGKVKTVGIYRNSVEMTRDAIRKRFSIDGDFELQAKLPNTAKPIAIDDEDDVEDLQKAQELIVPEEAGAVAQKCERIDEYGRERQLVLTGDVMSKEIQGMEICGIKREKTYLVQINNITYTLSKPPPMDSKVVRQEMENLASGFDIEEVIRQIDIVAMCLKMVLYGVVGNRELELKVVEMQAKVEELCNVSGGAVKQFGMKAGFILSQMQHGIESLMDGYGEIAAEHFRKIAKTSKAMKETTESLKKALENLDKAVKDVSSAVAKVNSAHMKATEQTRNQLTAEVIDGRRELIERRIQQAKADRELAEKRYESMPAGDDKDRVKALLDSKQAKLDAAICFCPPGVCCIVCCDRDRLVCRHNKRRFFWYSQSAVDAGVQAEYKLLDRDKADRAEALQERERLRKAVDAATNELIEFTESLKNVDPTKEPEDLIEIALRGAETGFKALKSAMSRITLFWDDLHLQSESIIDAGCSSIGKMESEKDATRRGELLKSRSFQTGAVEYLAKWVAMRMMCEAFTKALKPIQKALQCSIADTPSKQQALKAIPELVITLDKKLHARKEALRADDETDAAEMKAIRAE